MAVDPALGATNPAHTVDVTTHETDVTAVDDAAATPSKKRRRSGGPARAAREAAFLADGGYVCALFPLYEMLCLGYS